MPPRLHLVSWPTAPNGSERPESAVRSCSIDPSNPLPCQLPLPTPEMSHESGISFERRVGVFRNHRSCEFGAVAKEVVSPDRRLGVLIVEEHALIRAALGTLIGATTGLTVVAEAKSMSEALTVARSIRPEAILVGASLLRDVNSETTGALHAALPDSCIFVVGGDGETSPVLANAVRCLPRDAGINELCADVSKRFGIRCDDCGLQALCPVARAVTALSRREQQVAVRVAAGLTSKQIASMLGLAIRTVNTYRESLSRKLGASSAAALTRYVIESGLRDTVTPDADA